MSFSSTALNQRQQVLRIYRRILKFGKTWTSIAGPKETEYEREYISNEAKTLFRKNRNLTDPKAITDCIQEAQARLELAIHYQTPYPRPVNLPFGSLAKRKGKEQGSMQEKIKRQSQPIYIKSKFD